MTVEAPLEEVIADNEQAVARSLSEGRFVEAYLVLHSLVEALLRTFLDKHGDSPSFHGLVENYVGYIKSMNYAPPTFVDELTQFNRRRNRIVHKLWEKGYTATNRQAEPAAYAAATMYGLLIEWLQTFGDSVEATGFRLSE